MRLLILLTVSLLTTSCGTDADELGIRAECVTSDDCPDLDDFTFVCLTRFTGGYCGIDDCVSDADCPASSACVVDDGGGQYCARLCEDKVDCNANRNEDVEANCVGSITFVDDTRGDKACEPSSSGI